LGKGQAGKGVQVEEHDHVWVAKRTPQTVRDEWAPPRRGLLRVTMYPFGELVRQ
jgi:hypothetical protein